MRVSIEWSLVVCAAVAVSATGCAVEVDSTDAGSGGGGGAGGSAPASLHGPFGTHRPCAGDPGWCAEGETCWPSPDGVSWSCLAAAQGAHVGDACALGPAPTCGEGELCLAPDGAAGTCARFCDPAHGDADCGAHRRCVDVSGPADDAHACVDA
ncbi:MAG TPA: hypothetical protein VHB21_08985 [Minicystis sp.]|nr:hypothetical protein [Minicystis sp.]